MVESRRLGSRYTLDTLVGEGASGQVWLGSDAGGRVLAFKLLRSELAADAGIVNRFVQERAVLASIRHPQVVAVHDLVIEGATLAIVMDYVQGVDLRAVLRQGGCLAPEQVARWGEQIAAALGAAHANGVVHRDVKPENVLIESGSGSAKLTDFGIAKLVDGSARSTMLLGTPQYMAPEIAEGRDPSPAADVYSLGIVLYEMSCGVPPFAGRGSAMATLRAHALDLPGRPAGMPDPMWDLLSWMLHKDPDRRPGSAQQVAQALAAQQPQLRGVAAAAALTVPPPPRTTTPFAAPAGAEDLTIVPGSASSHPGGEPGTVVVDRSAVSLPGARRGSSVRPVPGPSLLPGASLPAPPPPFAASVPLAPAGPSRRSKGLLIGALSAVIGLGAFLTVFLLLPRLTTTSTTPSNPTPLTTTTPPTTQPPTITVPAPPPPVTSPQRTVTVTVPVRPPVGTYDVPSNTGSTLAFQSGTAEGECSLSNWLRFAQPADRQAAPREGQRWVAFKVLLRNTGQAPLAFSGTGFVLLDTQGRWYRSGNVSGDIEAGPRLLSGQLGPGQLTSGYVVTEVPAAGSIRELRMDPAYGNAAWALS